jgi:hypothetical protein
MGELAAALADLQGNLPRIVKDSAAIIQPKEGGKTFGYRYADLATVSELLLPELSKRGLSFICAPTLRADGKFVLEYLLQHATDDEAIRGAYPLPTGRPQEVGSAITYARRYALCAVTGAAPDEDDDGQEAERGAQRIIDEVRGMRRKDPEVDEHGAATLAEQTRMMTGSEGGVHRSKDAVVDDRWTTDAPSWLVGVDPPEDQPGSILEAQRKQIMAVYSALGKRSHDDRMKDIENVLGVALDSTNLLSHQQAARLLENLHERHTGKMTRR